MKRTTAATAAGLATLATFGLVTATGLPAHAASAVVVDGDDSRIAADILKVRVNHTAEEVVVKVRFDDLVRDARVRTQGLSLWFDTRSDDRGPEYRLGSGLNDGTDYSVSRVDTFKDDGRMLMRCEYVGRIDWERDTATYRIQRPCLKAPADVRVAVKSGEWSDNGNGRDWVGDKRSFTEAVATD